MEPELKEMFDDIKKTVWYKKYVSKFEPCVYLVNSSLIDEFDWPLLFQLTAASFSSNYLIYNDPKKAELHVATMATDGDKIILRTFSELSSMQIFNLYQIYVKEQCDLQDLMKQSPKDEMSVEYERSQRLVRWNHLNYKLKIGDPYFYDLGFVIKMIANKETIFPKSFFN